MPTAVHLSLVNNSESDLWLEVHNGDSEVRPVIQATRPLGPYSSKEDVVQTLGSWQAAPLAIFAFKHNYGDSFFRLDLDANADADVAEFKETLVATPVGRLYAKGAGATSSKISVARLVSRWIVFAIAVVVPIVAVVVFAIYRTFFNGKKYNNDRMEWPQSSSDIVFED